MDMQERAAMLNRYNLANLTREVAQLQELIKNKDQKIAQLQARVDELEAVAVFDPVESGR